jgi:hypothetical protein
MSDLDRTSFCILAETHHRISRIGSNSPNPQEYMSLPYIYLPSTTTSTDQHRQRASPKDLFFFFGFGAKGKNTQSSWGTTSLPSCLHDSFNSRPKPLTAPLRIAPTTLTTRVAHNPKPPPTIPDRQRHPILPHLRPLHPTPSKAPHDTRSIRARAPASR